MTLACVCGSGPERTRRVWSVTRRVRRRRQWFGRHPDEAQRALRVAARLHLLNTAHRQWHDVEGIDEVDMVASSGGAWKLWLESLSNVDKFLLSTWVAPCGLRRVGTVAGQVESRVASCAAEPSSARHLWAECSGTEAQRQELSREFEVPITWWSKQPRITSKSGWITTRAAATLQRRTALQVLACLMGMHVVKTGGAIHDQEDGCSCSPR